MAVTSQLTSIEDMEAPGATFTSSGYGSGGGATDNTDIFIEGSQSGGRRVDNITNKGFGVTFGSIDLSAQNIHMKCWFWVTQWPQVSNVRVRISDGTNDDDHTLPSAEYPPLGGFIPIWVDVSRNPETGGSANEASITEVGALCDMGNVGGAADNFILDEFTYGSAGLLWSGSSGDLDDFRTFESSNSEGVLVTNSGVDFCYSRLILGDSSLTTFNDSGFQLVFPSQALVSKDFMGITVDLQNGSTDIDFSDAVLTSGDVSNASTRPDLKVLSTSGAFDTNGVTFAGFRRLLLNGATTFVSATVRGSGQIEVTNGDQTGEMALSGTDEYVDTQENLDLSSTSGDFEIIMRINATDWTPTSDQCLMSHYGGTAATESFRFQLDTTGALQLIVSDGSAETTLTGSVITVSNGDWRWVRVTYDQSAGGANFYVSDDPNDTPSGDLSWTAAGTPTGTSRNIPSLSRPVLIGAENDATPTAFFIGSISYAELWTDGFRATGASHGDLILRADWRTGPDFTGSPSVRSDDFDSAGITWEEHGTSPTYTTADNNSTAANISGSIIVNSFSESAILWNVNTDPNGELDNIVFTSSGTGHAIELGPDTPGTITFTGHTYNSYAGTNGSTGNEVLYNNSGKAITINVSGSGDTPTYRNGTGASTTVQNTVTLTVTVIDDITGSPIQNAQVGIFTTTGTQLMNELTNVSGIATEQYSYVSDTDIIIRVRKSSTETQYIPVRTTGLIESTGFSLRQPLTEDTIIQDI